MKGPDNMVQHSSAVKPFIKWVGGKRQLLSEMENNLPPNIDSLETYVEPFVGGGAMLFHMTQNHTFKKIIINDANVSLINLYYQIKMYPKTLIDELSILHDEYVNAATELEKKTIYYNNRTKYNKLLITLNNNIKNVNGKISDELFVATPNAVSLAALFMFLNRTGFNGLYRVNSKGNFNTPFGYYKKPTILDKETILSASKVLAVTEILYGDYTNVTAHVDDKTFIYLDPPYRPLNGTSAFTSYAKAGFNDTHQKSLAVWVGEMNNRGAKILLSNSDPTNTDPNDMFFDNLYHSYNIIRVAAMRNINADGGKRGKIREILVKNY